MKQDSAQQLKSNRPLTFSPAVHTFAVLLGFHQIILLSVKSKLKLFMQKKNCVKNTAGYVDAKSRALNVETSMIYSVFSCCRFSAQTAV